MLEFKPVIWQESASSYQEIKPASALQPYIDCYWLSFPQGDGHQARVIPDLCADFIMTFTPEKVLKKLRYSGPFTRYFISVSQSMETTLGVRFHLSALRNWLPTDLSQTKNQLLAEWEGLARFSEHLAVTLDRAPTFDQLIVSFNHFFLKELSEVKTPSSNLVKNVMKNSLTLIDYRDVIQREVISERTIQRLFREETGLSPYEVHDILRFQKTLKRMAINPEVNLTELALSHGYYDQAHYTRRFKLISGLTPTEIRQACRNYPRHQSGNLIK